MDSPLARVMGVGRQPNNSLSCEVGVDMSIGFIHLEEVLEHYRLIGLCINKTILCLTNMFNGSIPVIVYNCSLLFYMNM